ncbi:MAG: D-aminoacylase [Pseudomonadota bacterium]
MQADLLIRGADVLDGTGGAAYRADIAIAGDEILRVGNLPDLTARETLQATGLCVAPGFIDVHTHDDWAVIEDPGLACKITQGVTTVVAGNCGISAAPFAARDGLPAPFAIVPRLNGLSAPTVTEYARRVADAAPAVNVRLLVGHSTLRAGVMEDLDRAATPAEIETMATRLDCALREGAMGLSSGLDYPAASAAPMEEMVTLARVLARHKDALYTTHIRDEADGVIAAVREALSTATQAEVPLLLSHHKCAGARNFGKSIKTLAMIDAARQDQDVAFDVYPYTASSSALLPHFAQAAPEVLVIWSTPEPDCAGQMLDDIAAEWGVSRAAAIARLAPAGAVYFDMDEGDLDRILAHPASMIGSDGIPGTPKPHPRLWGTFPRVLGHYVRDRALLTLPQAVHKMTGLSAARFGLSDRGLIKPGMKADLTLFDPATVIDRADFDRSERASDGIIHVLVAGQMALTHGRKTDQRAGRFLHRKGD